MTEKGYMSDFFRQLQELNNKCNTLSSDVKEQKQKINSLENRVIELETENQKLKEDNDRLKKQINNDSNNSSKPPSSDIKKNIPNNREKSNKKKGAQKGHKAHFLNKKDIEYKITTKEYKHEIIDMGTPGNDFISKYVLDIEINIIAKEYRFYKDNKTGKYNIPKEFEPNVQYGSELKTICSVLNTEGIVAIDRLTDFVSSITHGKIDISHGSIINFIESLSNKSKYIIQDIETKVLNSTLLHTDATVARCNNKNVCVRNYSTKEYTLLKVTTGKGKKHIEETNILPRYTGNIVHDHETVIYNYGKKHGECNVHISRYLKGTYENTENKWSRDMRSFLNSLNSYKKKLMESGINSLSKESLQKYTNRYEQILEEGKEQDKLTKSRYHKKEEKKLLSRMEKYKENHLMFLYDFDMPFDNNLSERDLRHVKTKQKISGYWNNLESTQKYLDIKSIIGTCKKQGKDFYKMISNIYENIPVTI